MRRFMVLMVFIAGASFIWLAAPATARCKRKPLRVTYLASPVLEELPLVSMAIDEKGRLFLGYSGIGKHGCLALSPKERKILPEFRLPPATIPHYLQVSTDGRLLLIGDYGAHIVLIDTRSGKTILKRTCRMGALSPSGRLVAFIRRVPDKSLDEFVVQDIARRISVFREAGHRIVGSRLRFVGETVILTHDPAGNVRVWDLLKKKTVWKHHRDAVGGWFMRTISTDIHPGARIAVTGHMQGLLRLWTWPQHMLFDVYRPLGRDPVFVRISPDGSMIASYTREKIRFLSVGEWRFMARHKFLEPMQGGIEPVFSHDSRKFIWVTRENRIGFLEVPSRKDKKRKN